MTPQLALRVAIIGGLALLLFAIIFFRLWFVQVLSGTRYVAEAQSNVVAHIPVAAPRGEIVDAGNTPLVESVPVPSIQIAPRSLPAPVTLAAGLVKRHGRPVPPVSIPAKDAALFDRLAKLIGTSTKPHSCKYTVYWTGGPVQYDVRLAAIPCQVAKSVSQSSYANAAIKTNVPSYIQDYIAERPREFPGVLYQDTYVRKYPLDTAGAQTFGTYGPITAKEVGTKSYKGIASGNLVGQTGVEAAYNWALQGVNGEQGVKVNSQGQFEGYAKETKPTAGDTLKLSISAPLEEVGQRALVHSININHGIGGSFVALDPVNGQIYAMGSSPSYPPAKVSPSISNKEWAFLKDPNNQTPLLNRAIQSQLPDGSTFKPITATAALESGVWAADQPYDDTGKFCVGTSFCLRNSGGAAYGSVNLEQALEVSDDVYFYHLGDLLQFNPKKDPDGGELQRWAGRFGIGHRTGVDLPGEYPGEIGTPKLQNELWKQERQCDTATGRYKGRPKHPAVLSSPYGNSILSGGCGIASAQYWTIGDNIETGVGQYDDEVTPLQLAVVYAAIENGGRIVTPHVAAEVESLSGTVLQKIDPAAKRNLRINPAYLSAIQTGLHLAATGPSGTSTSVMGNFPKPVYGKTGTAELGNSASSPEHAWYACYVPDATKPIVVVVNVEKGGFGAVAAAPVAREILSQWFLGKSGPFVSGSSSGNQT
ncbi:MAG: penicillin-binding transpeptidase domain-containing protein [Solirubrobacteraceae bacterium]